MQRKRSGLGKGLDALIPGSGMPAAPSSADVLQLPTDSIHPNPHQPRQRFDRGELDELADSIREHGILQPLIVTQAAIDGQYQLIAGERRLQAARLAGLGEVPAIVREASPQQLLEWALIENVQRADLNPLETAAAYQQLQETFSLSHEEIAQRVGKSRVSVTKALRLLRMPADVQQAVMNGAISAGHAQAIAMLETPAAQSALLKAILDKDLNVRQAEALAARYKGQSATPSKPKQVSDPQIKEIEERVQAHLGFPVRLQHSDKGGSITIRYYNQEDLNYLIQQLAGEE